MIFLFNLFSFFMFSTAQANPQCTLQLQINSTIGPSTFDYMERGLERAKKIKCESILMLLNTPGGSLQTTRLIVETIVNSPIPFLCLVYPSGGHAGSAGAIILQACHYSGAMETTNIGAATPVAGTGEEIPKDLRNKLVNDTTSLIDGLTKLRGRSKEFGQKIVTEGKAHEAHEAQKQGGIDIVVNEISQFLDKANGKLVKLSQDRESPINTGPVTHFSPDFRFHLLELFTDPQFAYFLFMGSLALIYFEITHFGAIVPGVIGMIGLILSMISFHKLNVSWGGFALILLGVLFMIAEAFVPSFGALGIGGIISFIVGSVFLFDQESSEFSLSLSTILPTAIFIGLIMLTVAWMAFKIRGIKKIGAKDDLIGEKALVVSLNPDDLKSGHIELRGETWKFKSNQEVHLNETVLITDIKGLVLTIKKESSS